MSQGDGELMRLCLVQMLRALPLRHSHVILLGPTVSSGFVFGSIGLDIPRQKLSSLSPVSNTGNTIGKRMFSYASDFRNKWIANRKQHLKYIKFTLKTNQKSALSTIINCNIL
ncbi:hypothetical protein PanWU01x14_304140 [Parasponia andersonii]|uniref:Uncharacterized protein n=1 Tax=Parasponia andersonii TaxID=3476 RepID=A0A2P5ASJ8_PARAD|nr:hypothetical protein PanWU01x14_304140 [Parasponia andersonii]